MVVKAELKVQLFANDVLVAESDDAELWRRVFSSMQGKAVLPPEDQMDGSDEEGEEEAPARPMRRKHPRPDGPVEAFAAELGVGIDDVTGACSPDLTSPFIHLDQRYWEALKKNAGQRGRTAIGPTALAATLLCLWFKHAEIAGNPSLKQCTEVLRTIHLRDTNTARTLRNSDWLQTRGENVIINPAQWSKAVRVATAYCLKKAPKDVE
jgi:hypothetical protein